MAKWGLLRRGRGGGRPLFEREGSGTRRGCQKMSNFACTRTGTVDLRLRAKDHVVGICLLAPCTHSFWVCLSSSS